MKNNNDIKANLNRVHIMPKMQQVTKLKLSLRTVGVNVKIFNKLGNLVKTFPTITSAAKYFGVSSCTISCITSYKIFKGFILKLEEKDTRVWVYDCNKKLVKILNTTKETCEWYNINRPTLNGYIRSGKLYKKYNLYFYKNIT